MKMKHAILIIAYRCQINRVSHLMRIRLYYAG
jgi:hypothetical protein